MTELDWWKDRSGNLEGSAVQYQATAGNDTTKQQADMPTEMRKGHS
jgi:hypothetical protein